jgi:hypothetical protein
MEQRDQDHAQDPERDDDLDQGESSVAAPARAVS